MRGFCKGFLIGTACICILALAWLCIVRPTITTHEADALKTEYTQTSPGAASSGAGTLPAGERPETAALHFAALRADYPDVRAWLTIPGTVVDYPVLQSSPENPEYYLRRNYRGEWRTAGSLFFQADCSPDGRCLIVYGHNMGDGTMFGCLPQFLDTGYCFSHETVLLETPGVISEYRVVAVLETDVSRVAFNRTVFADDADFLCFADVVRREAIVDTGIPITADSRLLVLITCSYSWEDARVVVVAVQS